MKRPYNRAQTNQTPNYDLGENNEITRTFEYGKTYQNLPKYSNFYSEIFENITLN